MTLQLLMMLLAAQSSSSFVCLQFDITLTATYCMPVSAASAPWYPWFGALFRCSKHLYAAYLDACEGPEGTSILQTSVPL